MFNKFCVVLFTTIFCNGVVYSSPTKPNSSDLISKEQAATTEVVSHINHKIAPTNTAPDAGVHHIENPNVTISANRSSTEVKTISNSTAAEKITNQGLSAQNDTKTAADAAPKAPDTIFNGPPSNATPPAPPAPSSVPLTRNNTAPTPPTASSAPLTRNNTTTDLPPSHSSDMLPPIVPGQSTTAATTPAVPATTTKAPATKPAVATPTPAPAVSNSTGGVILVHDSSAKAQENRFDGASFVGGIVLTIGLTAIGFIAFKYYKSGKVAGNYRSL